MKILIAEDDLTSRRVLQAMLTKWGYEVIPTSNGKEAWAVLQTENPPALAILDWMMPEINGVELCRKIRQVQPPLLTYILLLTGRRQKDDVILGLEAGANDYIRKPFDREELKARVRVGQRVVELQSALDEQVKELRKALSRIRTLEGLLPICCYCKKIRSDRNYWQMWEDYLSQHTGAQFTHGVCPECFEKFVKPQLGNGLPDEG